MEQRYYPQNESSALVEVRKGLLPPENASWQAEGTMDAEAATEMASEPFTSTATTALTTLLQQEAHGRRNETALTLAWSGAFLMSMLWLIRHTGTTEAALKLNMLFCFAFMGVAGWGLCSHLSRRSYRRKHSLTNALSQINDKKQVGPLIRTLQVQNTPVRNLAKQHLITLLPTLHAGDASLLGEAERKILLRQLAIFPNDPGYRDLRELFSRAAYRREMDLRLAILKALEQVGGEQEIGAVERLIRGYPTLYSSVRVPQELKEAAKACLPYLQTRAADQRAGAQLLRASCLPKASSADLLRPAMSGASTPPEQLLRAGEPLL